MKENLDLKLIKQELLFLKVELAQLKTKITINELEGKIKELNLD